MAKKSRAEKFAERAAAEAAAAKDSANKHMSKYALKKIAQQNAERSGTVYMSAGAKAKEAEDLAAEQAKIRALTEDPDLIEHDLPATDRSYANVVKAAVEGANLIEKPQQGKPVEINYEGQTVTVYLRDGETDVPEKVLIDRYKKELRRKSIREARKQAMGRMRKAGTVRGKGSKTRVVIPKKLELERQIIETFGVETRDRLPDLYDPQERLSSTYKHNQLGKLLMSPIKRYLPPVVGRDPLAAYLDKWSNKVDTQGIFADAFAKIKHIRRHEDGFARVGLTAFLKFVEGIPKNVIIDDYAFDQHLFIKRREVTSFINTMKEPALRWAKQRHKYESSYAFVYFDTYPIHIKLGKKRTICIQLLLSIGVTLDGRKDLLAAIPDLASGRLTVAFWEKILENFKNLGMQNICFVVASTRCRYLELAVNKVFPEATMLFNLQEVLQHDSYALEAPHRKEFMADVAKLLECDNFEIAREQLSSLRDKWEPLMKDGHVILQGNIEYLKVHTLLSTIERRVFNSQKTVSSAAAMLLGLKASNDFFSDNAEIIVYIFYRYLLIAKPYWFEHQDEAVNNLTYSRIFTTLRRCNVSGAVLLDQLLGEQHESFMLRHFGSFGNGPVFNLNPARKRISLSGHIDNNTYAQTQNDSSKGNANAINSASNYISAALSANETVADADIVESQEHSVATENELNEVTQEIARSDEAVAILSPEEKALQAMGNYERKYNAFAQDQDQNNNSALSSSLTLLSSTQSAVIPYENSFANPFSAESANNLKDTKAKLESNKNQTKNSVSNVDEHSSAVPSRLAQAVFKENRLNFSGSFNGLDLSALSEYAKVCPLNLISGSLSPLSNTIDGTFGFTSVAVRPEINKVHKSSAVREALSLEFNAASKAAAEAKVAAAKAQKAAKIAAKEDAYNFGVQVVSATLLDKDSNTSVNELIEESKTLKLDLNNGKSQSSSNPLPAVQALESQAETTDAASYERVYTETTHDDYAMAKVAQNDGMAVSYCVDDDNGCGATIRPDETLRSQDDYEELKNVKSNIQTANTVLGMLRPSVARALRDDRIELKKAERALIYECLGEDFDFAKIENVAHTISPIFRTTMHEKNLQRRNKRVEEKKLARKEPRRRAHLNYLKRKAIKEAIAQDEARFGPYSSDALIPVNTVKDSARKKNVLNDSSFGAEVKSLDSLIKDTGGFDANRVIAKTDFSSGAPTTKVELSAAERNLTASAKDMFTLLDKFDPNEGQIGSLTLNTTPVAKETTSGLNISSVAAEAGSLNIAPVAKIKASASLNSKSGDIASEIVSVVDDAIANGDAAAANASAEEPQKKRLRVRRATKPSVKATVAAMEAEVKRKQAQKAKALENDGSLALKNAAKVSAKDLISDAESTLNITPVADAEVQVVPAPLRNRIYEEFNMTPGIKTEKPQRVNLKKTKKSSTK